MCQAPSPNPSPQGEELKRLVLSSASQFCKFALIPQPLLPKRENVGRIQSPALREGEGFRVRATKVGGTCSLSSRERARARNLSVFIPRFRNANLNLLVKTA
jgi:hypothetical protein